MLNKLKKREMVESSIPPLNDINKENVIRPVKLQNPLPNSIVDLSLEDLNTQVEVLDNKGQGFSTQIQLDVGKKVEDPNKQVEVSDDVEQCILVQTNLEFGNEVDTIVDDCKARFEEQVVLSKVDDGTENVNIARER